MGTRQMPYSPLQLELGFYAVELADCWLERPRVGRRGSEAPIGKN